MFVRCPNACLARSARLSASHRIGVFGLLRNRWDAASRTHTKHYTRSTLFSSTRRHPPTIQSLAARERNICDDHNLFTTPFLDCSGVSERLNVLIEGESLLNDATGIVVFIVFRDAFVGAAESSPAQVLITAVRMSLGGEFSVSSAAAGEDPARREGGREGRGRRGVAQPSAFFSFFLSVARNLLLVWDQVSPPLISFYPSGGGNRNNPSDIQTHTALRYSWIWVSSKTVWSTIVLADEDNLWGRKPPLPTTSSPSYAPPTRVCSVLRLPLLHLIFFPDRPVSYCVFFCLLVRETGPLVGLVLGMFGSFLLGYIIDDAMTEITLTLIVCFSSFMISESTSVRRFVSCLFLFFSFVFLI